MRVLVVDDEINLVRLIERVLVKHGYQVETAGDGAEALVKIKESLPDIVITDIMMPNMDGFELLAALRIDAHFATIRIVLLSISPYEKDEEDEEDNEGLVREGLFDGLIRKRFGLDPREIIQEINRLAEAIQAGHLETP